MKKLSLFLIAISIPVVCLLIGCDGSTSRYELVAKVDQLLASPNSEWVVGTNDNGKFYFKIENGSIRVKADGSVDLITDLEGGKYSKLIISYPDGTRAAKVAKRFGIKKLSSVTIETSSAIQAELIKDAIVAISNSMKSSVVFESTDGIKE